MRKFTKEEKLKKMEDQYMFCDDECPSVYVGTYHKYNCGSLQGEWVALNYFDDYEDFQEFIHMLHDDEQDPEFMFQDFQNFPKDWYCESGLDEETFNKIKEFAELDTNERDAFEVYIDWKGDSNTSLDSFREAFQGEWDSEEDFAEHIFNECYECPENLSRYIDYERFARDIFMYDYEYAGGYVFINC